MATTLNLTAEADRMRRYTSAEMLRKIDERIERNIEFYATQPPEVVSRRIDELKGEWSMERCLQANAASVGFLTAFLGLVGNRKFALLTCTALGFFLFHGLKGFDPPIPLLRRMGVRTRTEIDREIYALKAIRGDFKSVPRREGREARQIPARPVLEAINA